MMTTRSAAPAIQTYDVTFTLGSDPFVYETACVAEPEDANTENFRRMLTIRTNATEQGEVCVTGFTAR